jgi:hypothetical protein
MADDGPPADGAEDESVRRPARTGYRRQEVMFKVHILVSSVRVLLVEIWEDFQRHW